MRVSVRQAPWDTWLADDRLDPGVRKELSSLVAAGRTAELQDRFAGDLQFGTGGLRARIGAGSDRMNVHTVRKATYGVVRWLQKRTAAEHASVVICFDGRRMSREFALETALVAAALGVKSFLFPEPRPTPLLSFAVRHLGCAAGVMVTASHNPPEYNGYKAYGADGGQLLPADAEAAVREMGTVQDLFAVPRMDEADARARGLLVEAGADIEAAYLAEFASVLALAGVPAAPLRIVYTPLHGVGGTMVPGALARAGFADVRPVALQSRIDGEFTHVKSPNPEEPAAYDLALEEAKSAGAELIIATDPDADRMGIMAREGEHYRFFTGNEIGGLLVDYVLTRLGALGTMPAGATVVTTNVTSDLGEAVASAAGVATERVLTGFKFIGARIREFEETGGRTFVFGYEESVGFLAKPFVRDKDSVQASVLIAAAAAYHKAAGRTLAGALHGLFERLGHFSDRLLSYTFEGQSGAARMGDLMADLRARPLAARGMLLTAVEDCLTGIRHLVADGRDEPLDLPRSDVVKYRFGGAGWVAARPSGTEPKLKVYVGARAESGELAEDRLRVLEAAIEERVAPFLT